MGRDIFEEVVEKLKKKAKRKADKKKSKTALKEEPKKAEPLKVSEIVLEARMNKEPSANSKMAVMSQQTLSGQLSSYGGIFKPVELTSDEKKQLKKILEKSKTEDVRSIEDDLNRLINITVEVKSINNQAALLHGELIKKAHRLLTTYKKGAFTNWMIAAYGNRQTPYNFMQYYDFHCLLPPNLRKIVEAMPRQAIYSLASRKMTHEEKQTIVENFKGETKETLMENLREVFPLEERDQRALHRGDRAIRALEKVYEMLNRKRLRLTSSQKGRITELLKEIGNLAK